MAEVSINFMYGYFRLKKENALLKARLEKLLNQTQGSEATDV